MLDYLLHLSLKIEPIFNKIIYMSIIASLVGIVILIIRKVLKNQISPTWINRIWLVFIISLIIPIQIKSPISVYNYIPINEDAINYTLDEFFESKEKIFFKGTETLNEKKIERNSKNEENYKRSNSYLEQENNANDSYKVRQFIPVIWGIIVVTTILAYILTYIAFEMKLRKYKYENDEIERILTSCKEKLNVKIKIKIVNQDIIKIPALFGIFNVRILIDDKLQKFSNDEIKHIFMHELSHYKRKDNILNVLITILRVTYFFNPIIWISLNSIKNDLEFATDELAMKNECKEVQKQYSKTILKLSIINSNKFLLQTLCISDGKKNLERRIDNIKKIEMFKNKKILVGIFSISIMFLIMLILLTQSEKYIRIENVKLLIEKGNNVANYYMEFNDGDFQTRVYKYNNELYQISENIKTGEKLNEEWESVDSNEGIYINYIDKIIQIKKISELNTINEKYDDFFDVSNEGQYYYYKGIESLNGRKNYKVVLKNENNYSNNEQIDVVHNFWIDLKNGLIVQTKLEILSDNLEFNNTEIMKYDYKLDVVKKIDIRKPNVSEYSDYKIINYIDH